MNSRPKIDRRKFLTLSAAMASASLVSACSSTSRQSSQGLSGLGSINDPNARQDFNYSQAYAAVVDTEVSLPAFDYQKMDGKYLRQWVNFRSRKKPGTVIVDTSGPHLFLVQPGGKAIRYGIAVGREGFAWHGDAIMKWKQKWPTWTPPPEMIARTPELREFADGMPAGVNNPLGARALYLFKDGRDTLFRIHGTNRPFSIGKAASSGCFRMINQDVIHLYERVPPGSAVYVKPNLNNVESGV